MQATLLVNSYLPQDLTFSNWVDIASMGLTAFEAIKTGYRYFKKIYPSYLFYTIGGSNMVLNEQIGVVAAC